MRRYRLTHSADRDLTDIILYINARSPQAADRTFEMLDRAMSDLAQWPDSGHRREDLTRRPYRFWPVGNYLIAYDPRPRPIVVIRIVHAARLVAAFLESDGAPSD